MKNMLKSKTDILLELKEKHNIWIDANTKELKAWYKDRSYAVPISDVLIDQRHKILENKFKAAMKDEVDHLTGIIWMNQRKI